MTDQQPQQQQQPQQPQQPQQAPQPPQPVQGSSFVSFNTTAPQNVNPALLANQAAMIEDYQKAANSNEQASNGSANAYQSIVEQQNAQIAALIEQNNALNQQVVNMLQNGAQFNQQQQAQTYPFTQQQSTQFIPKQQAPQQVSFPNVYQPDDLQAHPLANFNPPALSDNQDYSLEGLADQIGKRD